VNNTKHENHIKIELNVAKVLWCICVYIHTHTHTHKHTDSGQLLCKYSGHLMGPQVGLIKHNVQSGHLPGTVISLGHRQF